MRRYLIRMIPAVLLAIFLTAVCYADGNIITTKKQLNSHGMTVGVGTGSAAMLIAKKEFPDADIQYFDNSITAYEAVAGGNIHAFIYDRRQMELAIREGQAGVHLLDENMDERIKIAVGISPVCRIPDFQKKVNAFIAEIRRNGTLQDMYDRWVINHDETMPDIAPAKNPQYHLKVGTSGVAPPYTYHASGGLTGYDIELAKRFAAWLGADLTFMEYDYGGLITAAITGDVDCVMANLNITPERAESIPFSDVLYEEAVGIMVQGEYKPAYTSLDQLAKADIGIPTGTNFDQLVSKKMPDAKLHYFNNQPDMMEALMAGNIEAFPSDEPVIRYIMGFRSDLAYIPDYLDTFDFAYCFPRTAEGQKLCSQFNEFLAKMKKDGTLDALTNEWFSADESVKSIPDYRSFPATNGTLVMATSGDYMPFDYVLNGELAGYDVDLAAMFCEEYGYGLRVDSMNMDGVLPAVQSGRCHFAGAAITVTPERAETVLFSDPNYSGGMVLVVRNLVTEGGGLGSTNIRDSFEKTFIREDRWKLFVEGSLNTLKITVLTILSGTALGFGIFMLCRNGNKAADLITRFCIWLVQGTPMVVLLMILYYIVFRGVSISGMMVSVIGFTLTFAAAVFGLLRMGVGAVDRGQYEAAYALGYSNRRTFFRIILPQALPHVISSYKGEIVSLIKATSIVGYIAVQDLTKMGDIVRSRTFEAFFPLISITVIYFILEGLVSFLTGRVTILSNSKRRSRAKILKGVKTGDPD